MNSRHEKMLLLTKRNCCFGVESKSFKIFLESVNGKAVEKIVETGQGFSS